jgi:hypothetical protein
MKELVIDLSVGALISGLISAWYWHRAAEFFANPPWAPIPQHSELYPKSDSQYAKDWIKALRTTLDEGGRLNSIGARWTALAIVLTNAAAVAAVY